jgi:glycosyltransferase involved in cell wall biosynthesis
MKDKPLVSVIVNCFNGKKYLSEAIDSVVSQNYSNWELIFWDNLSTDSSAKIFNQYNDKRLKYFLATKHTNLSEARALAIAKSQGELIAFLDVDDYWKDSILETQVALYKDDDVVFSCGNFYIITEFSKQTKIFKKGKIPSGYVLNNLLVNYSVGMLTLSVRRSTYDMVGGFSSDYHIIGDLDLVIKLASKGKMGSFQEPLAVCRKDGNNESIMKVDMYIEELKNWYEKNAESYKKTNNNGIKAFYSSILFKEYNYHINNNSFSFSLLLSAFKRQPFINFFKIIVKIFIKKITGARV